MSSNIWIGDGRLTRDPELRATSAGKAVSVMRLAVDRPGDGDTADFFDVVAFGHLAEVTTRYLAKGRRVLVEGTLRHQTWTDNESGDRRARVEIHASRVTFLDGPRPEADSSDDAA
jgi:single-strand DNA-binding protein